MESEYLSQSFLQKINDTSTMTQEQERALCRDIAFLERDIWQSFAEFPSVVEYFLSYLEQYIQNTIRIHDVVKTVSYTDESEKDIRSSIISVYKKIRIYVLALERHKKRKNIVTDEELCACKKAFYKQIQILNPDKKIIYYIYEKIKQEYVAIKGDQDFVRSIEDLYSFTEWEMLYGEGLQNDVFLSDRDLYRNAKARLLAVEKNYCMSLEEIEDFVWRIEHDVQAISRIRNLFVEKNMNLLPMLAKKLTNDPDKIADYVQEGCLGLLIAADKFEDRGTRFRTYAVWWIKQSILLACTNRLVHVPKYIFDTARKIQHILRENETFASPEDSDTHYEAEPLDEVDIAEKLNEKQSRVQRALRYAGTNVISFDENQAEQLEIQQKDDISETSDAIDRNRLSEILKEVFAILTQREEEILIRRYGLQGKKPETLEELGEAFGVTRQRIRQIEKEALQKLRQPVYGNVLASWFFSFFGDQFLKNKHTEGE